MEGLLSEFVKQGLQVIGAFCVMSLLGVIVFAILATWDDPIVIEPWEADDAEDSREFRRPASGDPVTDYYRSGAYVGEAREDDRT